MATYTEKELVRVLVLLVCSLSVIGSLLIIASYVFVKNLRTNANLVLLHLSIMDLGTALANMAGTAVDFDAYYDTKPSHANHSLIFNDTLDSIANSKAMTDDRPNGLIRAGCITQAVLTTYFNLGSLQWTLSMACFLYLKILYFDNKKLEGKILYFIGLICYLLPLLVICWAYYLGRLGYSRKTSEAGWCGYRTMDRKTGEKYTLMLLLGYGIWIALLYTLVPILYIGILLHIRLMIKESRQLLSPSISRHVKLFLIPLSSLLLQIWSLVHNMRILFLDKSNSYYQLVILSVIGDSGQGFINAVIFVLLMREVRHQLFCSCSSNCRNNQTSRSNNANITPDAPEDEPLIHDDDGSAAGNIQ